MRAILTILIVLNTFIAKVNAANITIIYKEIPKKEVKVTMPVDGTVFWANNQLYTPTAENKIVINNQINVAGKMQVWNEIGSTFSFYILPDQSYTITFDLANKNEPFRFSGKNEEGQYLLNKIKHRSYDTRADSYAAKDSVFSVIQSKILADAEAERKQFEALFTEQKIDNGFYEYAQLEIKYYYAAILSYVINWNTKKPGFADAWPAIFETYSLSDPKALATTNFYDYAETYTSGYHGYLRREAGFNKVFDTRISNEYILDWHQMITKNLPSPNKEYMLARFLYGLMNMKKYEPELALLFDQFKTAYPKSSYSKFLQPLSDEIVSFHEKAKLDGESDQRIIPNYLSINSLEELTQQFKGKTVFVDFWATWCSPCKEEFAFNEALKKFAKSKNVAILYISMDDDNRDQQWKDMIKFYKLSGTHIRASVTLKTELINKIWKRKNDYSIPRYLVIRDGKIVEDDAKRPSDKQVLYDQLAKYLM